MHNHYRKYHVHYKTALLTVFTVLLSTAMYFVDHGSFLYKISVVSIPQHKTFDGTTYPIQRVPDYVHLSSEKRDWFYSSLDDGDFVDTPLYDPAQLAISSDTLKWGNSTDDKIRNAKIVYSVPYMGSYRLNGLEYDGSHLAVDIKVPENTPVYAMANGTVIKTSTQSSGFGHHVVLQHNNFPSLDDPNAKTTVYSSYSHLNDLLVIEGDVVVKGEQIALVGKTGTATTSHLHFQIDNSDAPWHPFWPFTWQESSDAGLSFFEAVNAGLGKDRAMTTTINPMLYVQKYLDGNGVNAESYVEDASTVEPENVPEESVPEEIDEDVGESEEIVNVEESQAEPAILFSFEVEKTYVEGQTPEFKILLIDQYGNVYKNSFEGSLGIKSANDLFTLKNSFVEYQMFDGNGEFLNEFKSLKEGRDKLIIEYNGETYSSTWFDILPNGTGKTFSDVSVVNPYYQAIDYLSSKGIVSGYPDGTFKPNKTVSRVEVLKFILEGTGVTLKSGRLPFKDVSEDDWYGRYLYTAFKKDIVSGDPDGKYRPADTVNKAEFFKILFNSMKISVPQDVTEKPFKDVPIDSWFAPYISYAKSIGIIDSVSGNFGPAEGMSRGEVAMAMWRLLEKGL